MTVLQRLRCALLASLVLLGSFAATARSAAAGTPCLSSRVGELLSAKIAEHSFDGALPAGWRLADVGVAGDHIDVQVLDDQQRRRGVALRLGTEKAGDGRGRWFVFVVDGGGAALDEAGRRGLLELAARVDAAIPEDEASRVCDARSRQPTDAGWRGGRGRELPLWVPLMAGAIEILALGALTLRRRGRSGESAAVGHKRVPLTHYAALGGALVLFVVSTAPAIPYDFCDLCYFFSLEDGQWGPQEWMHPLWVPFLGGYRALLGLFAFQGHMLVPVEVLNVGIAVVALLLLFSLARRVTGDSFLAIAATLTTAGCNAFWSAAVRPTPYALAFLCLATSLSLLVSDDTVPPRRYAVAGAIAGLAMALHASAMALAPIALICAAREPDPAKTRARTAARTASFVAAMIASAVVCWGLFIARNHITLDYFRNNSFATTFAGIEQVPGSSIYSSHNPWTQASELAGTLLRENSVIFYVGVPLLLVIIWSRWRGRGGTRPLSTPIERRFTTAALANIAVVGGFFLINNTHNGFVFASLALIPTLLALLAAPLRTGRALFLIAAAIPVITLGSMAVVGIGRARAGVARDPLLVEVRYLSKQLGPKDVLLTPGCPFAELHYLTPLNMFDLRDDGAKVESCQVPEARIDSSLRNRVEWWTQNGGRVWLALGDEVTDFAGKNDTGADNPNGAEKTRQIYWDARLAAPERAGHLAAVRAAMDTAGLSLGSVVTSPAGKRYAEVRARTTIVARVNPSPAPFSMTELTAAIGDRDSLSLWRARILHDMSKALPDDPWGGCDRMQLACDVGARRGDTSLCVALDGCSLCDPPTD